MFNQTRFIIAAAILSAAFGAMPAMAGPADSRSVTVQSGDLNLAGHAGRAVLEQRIAHAVDAVCGSAHPRTTADVQAYAACRQTARAGATAQFSAIVAKAESGKRVAVGRSTAAPTE
jgi:UrcA family protein